MEKPAQYDIAQLAYALWERDGRPAGRDQEYWFHAERELIGAATVAEDRPIGEIRQAEQVSPARHSPEGPQSSPTPPSTPITPAPTTAAEDRPIGEIRQAQQASMERADTEKPEASGMSLLKAKKDDGDSDLTEQLKELQRMMAKTPATPKPSTKPRAKKATTNSKASGDPAGE